MDRSEQFHTRPLQDCSVRSAARQSNRHELCSHKSNREQIFSRLLHL